MGVISEPSRCLSSEERRDLRFRVDRARRRRLGITRRPEPPEPPTGSALQLPTREEVAATLHELGFFRLRDEVLAGARREA